MPDKDPKATMGTEDTHGDMASPESQDSRPSVFHNIKVPLGAQQRQGRPSLAGQALPLTGCVTSSKLLPSRASVSSSVQWVTGRVRGMICESISLDFGHMENVQYMFSPFRVKKGLLCGSGGQVSCLSFP